MFGPAKVETTVKSVELSDTSTQTKASTATNKKIVKDLKKGTEVTTENSLELVNSTSSADIQKFLDQRQVVTMNQRNVFFGLGVTSKGKPKGIAGGNAGIPGAALTSDGDKDHAVFGILNFNF
jgi:hypothetical protein